ncbi:MAG: helix-turn-helix domain-containing protein [Pseudonocardiaceae bacterium]
MADQVRARIIGLDREWLSAELAGRYEQSASLRALVELTGQSGGFPAPPVVRS